MSNYHISFHRRRSEMAGLATTASLSFTGNSVSGTATSSWASAVADLTGIEAMVLANTGTDPILLGVGASDSSPTETAMVMAGQVREFHISSEEALRVKTA